MTVDQPPKSSQSFPPPPPVALSVAGFDPSGGAGVIADIKTFAAFGCFATAAITSLTYQNTVGVFGAAHQSAATVREQVLPIVADFQIAGAKTGMLPTREVIEEVARLFREERLPAPVVDPVVRSTSGYDLIDEDALRALIEKLLPLAALVTPNILEAERITGEKISGLADMERSAEQIKRMGARAVLIKGGHSSGAEAIDVLSDERGLVTHFRAARVESGETHGTGCTLAAAIAANFARGRNLIDGVERAKRFVTEAIRRAPHLGRGDGPVGHDGVVADELFAAGGAQS